MAEEPRTIRTDNWVSVPLAVFISAAIGLGVWAFQSGGATQAVLSKIETHETRLDKLEQGRPWESMRSQGDDIARLKTELAVLKALTEERQRCKGGTP